jgi:proteic killer suppression protein
LDIYFKDRKLSEALSNSKACKKAFGDKRSRKIQQRLLELKAAACLAHMYRLPQAQCHPLKGNRKGQFAVSVSGNYRLIFAPNQDLRKTDRSFDIEQITEIVIIGIEDYHGD